MIRRTTIDYTHVPMRKYPHRAVVRSTIFGRVVSQQEYGCEEFSASWYSLPDCDHASTEMSVRLNSERRRHELALSEAAS